MKWYYLTPLILQKIIWIPTRLSLRFFVHLEIRGLENLDQLHRNVIFVSNHTSELDPILLPASLSFWSRFSPTYYASREKGFYSRSSLRQFIYGGLLFKMWGAHQVFSGYKDYETSLANHIKLLTDGKNVYVFPEGRITQDGALRPAHGGVGYLLERTGCPVVPFALVGAYGISWADFFLRRRHIIVNFGPPIYTEEIHMNVDRSRQEGGNVYKEEAEYMMSKVKELLLSAR